MTDEVLVRVEDVAKVFCRSLKKSLWYGLSDLAAELLPSKQSDKRTASDGSLRRDEFWAVKSVSFELKRGECLGLIGSNGAGKTTLLKMLNGLIKPDKGRIMMRGRVGALIALGAGFNPVLTGRENIYVNGSILGLKKREIEKKLDDIIEFADIREFIDAPIQSYSSGMHVRLGYAVAACLNPDILMVDELLAVGDAAFQRKCMDHMHNYVKNGGCLILVAHNMHAIQSICNSCAVLDRGHLRFIGATAEGVRQYYAIQTAGAAAAETVKRPNGSANANQPVIIEGVAITSLNGGPITTREPMRIALHYLAYTRLEAIDWGFSIWTHDLQVRVGTATASWGSLPVSLPRGSGVLQCIIADVPLLGNTYYLKAGIYDARHSWPISRIGWEDAPVRFEVESPAQESYNRQRASGDLVVFDVEWNEALCPELQ